MEDYEKSMLWHVEKQECAICLIINELPVQMRKVAFWPVICRLLNAKRRQIAMQKVCFCIEVCRHMCKRHNARALLYRHLGI